VTDVYAPPTILIKHQNKNQTTPYISYLYKMLGTIKLIKKFFKKKINQNIEDNILQGHTFKKKMGIHICHSLYQKIK
jgi:xylose isomerase